jgi:hypothetical protein
MRFIKTNKTYTNTRPRQRRQPSTFTEDRQRPAIFSYRAMRGERSDSLQRLATSTLDGSQRVKGERRQQLLRRLRLIAAGLLLLAIVVSQSIISQPPRIVFDNTGSNSFHYEATAYAGTAAKLANSSVFNKTKWTFNSAKLDSSLRQAFPELANVQTTLPLIGNTPTVHLNPGTPSLLLKTAANQTFLVDQRGVAVATASSGQAHGLVTIDDQSGIAVQPGQPALPTSTVAFIQTIIAQLNSQKITLTAATLPARSSELDIHIAGSAYIGKFNLQSDARQQAGSFAAVKGSLDTAHTGVGQYIDVCVPGRAYYL